MGLAIVVHLLKAIVVHLLNGENCDGYRDTRLFGSAHCGKYKPTARAVPHYGFSRSLCRADAQSAARPVGIRDRRRQGRLAPMGLEVVSRLTDRVYHG